MRGMQRGVFKAGRVCVDFCSRREDTFFPGFSLPTQVSLSLSWLSWAFSCAFSYATSVSAGSVNCRNTFGVCMEDSKDGCATDPWPSRCGQKGIFKALGSTVM